MLESAMLVLKSWFVDFEISRVDLALVVLRAGSGVFSRILGSFGGEP
jgi:hypothetical protein